MMGNADKKPLISVIVPVYKVEQYLNACVDSILAQTYTNLEIILVDDGSPDSCGAICDEYAEKDSHVRVIHKENGGASAARNDGMKYCTGDYLAFIDSDDTVAPDWIENLYASISDYDFVIAGLTYVKNGENNSVIPPSKELVDLVKCSLFGYTCNKLYRKAALDGNEYCGGLREDLLFNLSLVASGRSYTISDVCGYYYCQRQESLLHTISVQNIQTVFDFEEQLDHSTQALSVSDRNAVYNQVMYSYVTDYIYKMLLSEKLSNKEKKRRIKQIVAYQPLKEKLKKQYADNTLYRILHLGIVLKAGVIVRYGFELCQKH